MSVLAPSVPDRPPRGATWIYWAGLGAPVAMVLFAMAQTSVGPEQLFDDAAHWFDGSPLVGSLSAAADFAWVASAAICLFAAAVLGPGREGRAVRFAGAIALVLALDDFYMIHEHWLAAVAGVPESITKAIYLSAIVAYVATSREVIARGEARALVLSGAMFVASLVADNRIGVAVLASVLSPGWHAVVEDAPKVAGIILWSLFHVHLSWLLLTAREPAAPRVDGP